MCGFVENSFQNLFSQYRFSQIGTLELTIKVNFHSSTQPMYHVLFRTCYHYDGQPHGQTFILLLNMVMLKSIFWYLDGGIRLLVISSFFFVFTKLCVIVLHDWMVKEYKTILLLVQDKFNVPVTEKRREQENALIGLLWKRQRISSWPSRNSNTLFQFRKRSTQTRNPSAL